MLIAVKHNEITDMNEIRKVAESYIRNELIHCWRELQKRSSPAEESEIVIQTNHYRLEAQNLSVDELSKSDSELQPECSRRAHHGNGNSVHHKGSPPLNDVQDFENLNEL